LQQLPIPLLIFAFLLFSALKPFYDLLDLGLELVEDELGLLARCQNKHARLAHKQLAVDILIFEYNVDLRIEVRSKRLIYALFFRIQRLQSRLKVLCVIKRRTSAGRKDILSKGLALVLRTALLGVIPGLQETAELVL